MSNLPIFASILFILPHLNNYLFILFISFTIKLDKINTMENNKDLYKEFNEHKKREGDAPKVDMLKVMDNFKRSVNFYNSFGLNKDNNKSMGKAPLA